MHARIAARFVRPEPRHRALAYLQGIVSSTQRKNGWQLAEHAGEARPDGMQRLFNRLTLREVLLADLVSDDLRSYVLEQLGDPQAVQVIDETSFAGICAVACLSTTEPITDEGTPTCPLLALTIPEVRHLLAHLLWPPPRNAKLLLAWSGGVATGAGRASSTRGVVCRLGNRVGRSPPMPVR